MLIALCSGGHSPGVTTAGLALTMAWPREVLYAECDRAGGSLHAGYLLGQPRERGLGEWAVQLRRGADPARSLHEQTYCLTGFENKLILPGLAEPAQATSIQPLWPTITATFATLPIDVIADVGRAGGPDTSTELLRDADTVLLIARPNLVDLTAAAPRLQEIKHLRGSRPGPVILLVGNGPYSRSEVTRTLSTDVAAHFPYDPRAANVLSHGTGNDRYVSRSLLIRAARDFAEGFCAQAVEDEVMAR
ncbi:MinD/ParA family ATP-binding protein [Nonomuraea insulae]|uniref:MinD/ParA family protein n=1 Tax=Nonomuraea insulae TaxID=1616787 RepID=A0ABW1CYY3_9ACTN